MVFPEREGPKELEEKREREELWDLQEDRESKASREILALKESREKKVNSKIMMMIIIIIILIIIIITMIMTKLQVIFVMRDFAHGWLNRRRKKFVADSHGSASRFQNILTTVMTNIAVDHESTDHCPFVSYRTSRAVRPFFLSGFYDTAFTLSF